MDFLTDADSRRVRNPSSAQNPAAPGSSKQRQKSILLYPKPTTGSAKTSSRANKGVDHGKNKKQKRKKKVRFGLSSSKKSKKKSRSYFTWSRKDQQRSEDNGKQKQKKVSSRSAPPNRSAGHIDMAPSSLRWDAEITTIDLELGQGGFVSNARDSDTKHVSSKTTPTSGQQQDGTKTRRGIRYFTYKGQRIPVSQLWMPQNSDARQDFIRSGGLIFAEKNQLELWSSAQQANHESKEQSKFSENSLSQEMEDLSVGISGARRGPISQQQASASTTDHRKASKIKDVS